MTVCPDLPRTRARVRGFMRAKAQAGLAVPPAYIVHKAFTSASGQAAATRLLALPQRPSAMFVASDLVAIRVLCAATRAGV